MAAASVSASPKAMQQQHSPAAPSPGSHQQPQSASVHPSVFPQSHVGFDSITSQIERKLLKRGFQFNVMCVGMFTIAVVKLLSSHAKSQSDLWFSILC